MNTIHTPTIMSGPGNEPTALPPLTWQEAAQSLGERLATTGPTGYYAMGRHEWFRWATDQLSVARDERDTLCQQRDELAQLLQAAIDDDDEWMIDAQAALAKCRGTA